MFAPCLAGRQSHFLESSAYLLAPQHAMPSAHFASCPPAPAQTLHLTPQQKQQLLLQRQAHLTLMRRIYQQRQQLNMQASDGLPCMAWLAAAWEGSRPPRLHSSVLCLYHSLPSSSLPHPSHKQAMSLMLLGQQGAAAAAAAPSTSDNGAAAPNSQTSKLATVLKLVKVRQGARADLMGTQRWWVCRAARLGQWSWQVSHSPAPCRVALQALPHQSAPPPRLPLCCRRTCGASSGRPWRSTAARCAASSAQSRWAEVGEWAGSEWPAIKQVCDTVAVSRPASSWPLAAPHAEHWHASRPSNL